MRLLETLDPKFRAKIETLIANLSEVSQIEWRPISCRRTIAEQNALYAKGRTAPGDIVTRAKGGQSPHNFGLAVDLCPVKEGKLWWSAPDSYWSMYGELAEGVGLTWGGHFHSITDKPHVEDPGWKEVQAAWRRGEIHVA